MRYFLSTTLLFFTIYSESFAQKKIFIISPIFEINETRPYSYPSIGQIDAQGNLFIAKMPINPMLGFNLGVLYSKRKPNSNFYIEKGIFYSYKQFERDFLASNKYDNKIERSVFKDLEVPIIANYKIPINKISLGISTGFIPGWRIKEFYKWTMIDKNETIIKTIYSKFNHPFPFNRFNLFAGLFFNYNLNDKIILIAQPNVRFNIAPFMSGSGLVGYEEVSLSFALRIGVSRKF